MKKSIKAILAAFLCFALVFGALALAGCDTQKNGQDQDDKNNGSEQEASNLVSIVVMRTDVAKGNRISSRDIELKQIDKDDLLSSHITAKTDAIGMYAGENLSSGTELERSMLSATSPNAPSSDEEGGAGEDDARDKGYIVITDYVEVNSGKDVSADIQAVIDDNPQRTIYFPDGEYIIANPIATSGNPENAVALSLSNFAVIKAADGWSHSEAMIRLGGAEAYNNIHLPGSNYYLEGGCIDGNMVATGVSIDSGRETAIRNLSIKRTQIGIHIKFGANSGSSDADIETVNIVGNAKPDSIGVLIDGYDNTLTNMRIAAVQTGVMLKSGGNFLRNIHPLFIFGYEYAGYDDIDYSKSVAFHDYNSTNWYDYCYSDQMATAFRLSNGSKAVFLNCFAMWYSARDQKEVGFECDGDFNGSILNAKIHFRRDVANTAFLTQPEGCGGEGIIENPITNDDLIADKTYKKYVTGKIIKA